MTLIHVDGFDLGDYASRYVVSSPANTSAVAGRTTGQAVSLVGQSLLTKNLTQVPGITLNRRFTLGVAFNPSTLANASNSPILRFFSDNGTTTVADIFVAATAGTLAIRVYVGPNAQYTSTTAQPTVLANTYNHIEFSFYNQNSVVIAGTAVLKLNGVTLLEPSTFGSASNLDAFALIGLGGATTTLFDDLNINNYQGTGHTGNNAIPAPTFYGDSTVRTLIPDGNGTYSQLTGSDGNSTDNYLLVDELTLNNADYVEGGTVGLKDTYQFGNLPVGAGTVTGVQVVATARSTEPAGKKLKFSGRSNTQDFSSAAKTLTTTFADYSNLYEVNPTTGLPWTDAEINSAEFGVEVS